MSLNTLRQGRQRIGMKMYPSFFKPGTLLIVSHNNRDYHWLVCVTKEHFTGLACSIVLNTFKKSTFSSKLTNVCSININGWNLEPLQLRATDRPTKLGKTVRTINPSELPLYMSWHKTKEFETLLKDERIPV
jgi:hypothetical protein